MMKTTYKYNPQLPFVRDDIKGNLHIDGEYVFHKAKERLPYERLVKWMTTSNPQREEKKQDNFAPEVIRTNAFLTSEQDKIVWLGHSSFYIQLNEKRILTDPVFHDLTPFLRRKHALPCPIQDFKNIDYILLSHGHRDHLDLPTLRKISKLNPDMEILCPLGFKNMLQSTGIRKIQEAAWWQQYDIPRLNITFLPAKHWNRRFITDYNKTLWGSFSIQHQSKSIYFAGDTGYAHHFKEINSHFSSFDVCLMPIGAYKPKFIMEWAHTSPEEAIQAFHELNGKTFIPMHYGTFDLSDEPASEPKNIVHEFKQQNKLKGELAILKVGEEFNW